jgi:hypothetical protein
LNGPSIKKKNIKTSLKSKPDAPIPELESPFVAAAEALFDRLARAVKTSAVVLLLTVLKK